MPTRWSWALLGALLFVLPGLTQSPQDHLRAARASALTTVALRPGWNPVAFQASQLTGLQTSALALASFDGTAYQVQPATLEQVNQGEGGRRGFWVYASTASNLTYDGSASTNFLNLSTGWNLVSLASRAPVSGSTLQGDLSNVLPGWFALQPDGSSTPLNLATSVLQPGTAYWAYASVPTRLTWTEPTPSPSPEAPITSLTLTPPSLILSRYGSAQLQALAGTTDVSSRAAWSSSEPASVGVGPTGIVTGLYPGNFTVTASLQGFTATAQVRVTDAGVPQPLPSPPPGGRLYLCSNQGAGRVKGFANAIQVNGNNPTPTTQLEGAATLLAGLAEAPALDPGRNLLYVTVFGTNRMCSFSPASSLTGNVAPTRAFTQNSGANFNEGLTLDVGRSRLYAGASGSRVLIFNNPETLSGSVTPDAQITGFTSNVAGVAIDAVNDRLFVVATGGTTIDVFDNASALAGVVTRAGTVSRTVTGLANTEALFIDPASQRLYLARGGGTNQVLVFANAGSPTFTGAVSPVAILNVAGGMGTNPYVFVDTVHNELYTRNVSNVYVYANARELSGNSAPPPLRTISGLSSQFGITLDLTRD